MCNHYVAAHTSIKHSPCMVALQKFATFKRRVPQGQALEHTTKQNHQLASPATAQTCTTVQRPLRRAHEAAKPRAAKLRRRRRRRN